MKRAYSLTDPMASPPPPALGPRTPATAGFPREFLLENERVMIEVKPASLPFLLLPLAGVAGLLATGLLFIALLASSGGSTALAICGYGSILIVAVVGVGMIVSYLRWRGTFYAVTDRRLVASSGVLGRAFVDTALDKVQNVAMTQTWFQKAMGYGTISFATSGVGTGVANLQQGFRPWAIPMGAPGLYGNIAFFGVREPAVLRKRIEEFVEASVAAKKEADYRTMARAFKEEGTMITPIPPSAAPRTVQVQQSPEVIVLPPPGPKRFCEFCGSPVVGTPKYCERCGARLA